MSFQLIDYQTNKVFQRTIDLNENRNLAMEAMPSWVSIFF